jgi:hypothetical protein
LYTATESLSNRWRQSSRDSLLPKIVGGKISRYYQHETDVNACPNQNLEQPVLAPYSSYCRIDGRFKTHEGEFAILLYQPGCVRYCVQTASTAAVACIESLELTSWQPASPGKTEKKLKYPMTPSGKASRGPKDATLNLRTRTRRLSWLAALKGQCRAA